MTRYPVESTRQAMTATVTLDTVALRDSTVYRLHWGRQVDTRTITETADRDRKARVAHPGQVAAYLSKYLTKTTKTSASQAGSGPPVTPAQRARPRTRSG